MRPWGGWQLKDQQLMWTRQWGISKELKSGGKWHWGSVVTGLWPDSILKQLELLCFEIPPAATWLNRLVIHIRSQVKRRQSQSYKFKKIAKNSNFEILQETLHATHLLKLLDKMCKYEMDPTRTVGSTEQTRDVGRTDGQTDGRTETNILRCAGIIKVLSPFGIRKAIVEIRWSKDQQSQYYTKLASNNNITQNACGNCQPAHTYKGWF